MNSINEKRLSNQPFLFMKIFERYLHRNPLSFCPVFSRELSLIVIIPVLDEPELFKTLDSLRACRLTKGNVGVIVVVNHAENCDAEIKRKNEETFKSLRAYISATDTPGLEFYITSAFDLPVSESGVGVVRKMAMDAAAWYFYTENRPNGIIASLDADTLVEANYFEELLRYFDASDAAGVAIHYAHRWEEVDGCLREAIIKYEIYLRYYCRALRYTGHPYAYQCIGSAFACRAADYVAQGGMSKKQAGEDFYFLQKLIATGRFADLTTTTVWPSSRISSRTPFGTGQSVRKIMEDGGNFLTYNPAAFRVLKSFFDGIPLLFRAEDETAGNYMQQQPECLCRFLETTAFPQKIREINDNVASLPVFRKRFYDYFNAFRVLKYLNFVHAGYFEKVPVESAVAGLLEAGGYTCPDTLGEILSFLRLGDKTPGFLLSL